jgi:putative sulfotransferase
MINLHPEILSISEWIIMCMPGAFMGVPAPIQGPQFWAMLSTPRKRMTFMYRQNIIFDEVLYRPGPGRRFTNETGIPPILMTALPHLTDKPEELYDAIGEFVVAQGAFTVGQHYRRLYEWLRERFGRKLWIERSGSSMAHLGELLATFPDARYVHMFRDGRECAISMSKHSAFRLAMISGDLQPYTGVDPFNFDDDVQAEVPSGLRRFMPESFDREAFWNEEIAVERFGLSWAAQERRGIELLSQMPADQVLLLSYENLVADPHAELSRLLRFVGLEPDHGYLDRAATLVKVKPPSWPQLPDGDRQRLDEACRLGMALLYGSEVLAPA